MLFRLVCSNKFNCWSTSFGLKHPSRIRFNFRSRSLPSTIQRRNKSIYQFTKTLIRKCVTKSLPFRKIFSNNSLVFAAVGSFAAYRWKQNYVWCDVGEAPHTRIFGIDNIEKQHQDAHFDWRKFLQLIRSEVWYIFIAVLSALAVAGLNIHIPVQLGELVNIISKFIVSQNQGEVGDGAPTAFFSHVRIPAIHLIYLYIAQSVFTFIYIATLSVSGERVAKKLRTTLFSCMIEQDVAFFDAHRTGEISSRLTNDVQEFKSCYKLCISQGLRSLAQTAGCVVSLYLISPKMTMLMVCVLPLIIATGTVIGRGLRKMSKKAQSQIARASAVADEAIGNIRTVRAFAMEEKEMELYEKEVEDVRKLNGILGVGIGIFQGLSNLALNGIVLCVLYVGGSLMYSAEMSPGHMMSFLVATQTIQKSLAHLSTLFGQFIRGLAAGARIFQYINLEPTIPLTGGIVLPEYDVKGEVFFRNVHFSYPTRPDQVVLKNFSLILPPGKMVALCGLSGGGKSTVASLLERFYDVNMGDILIDGFDIRELDSSWLRREIIGYINQEPVLFATSVMENIRYGKPSATDTEVIEAAKLANADEFIRGFTDGYNTLLGERGATVSGGQKQRIAIARALLKDPKILILDEATSALDVESEKAVQDALDYATKGRTVLVIAHRLSTIQNADIIAVVAHGQILEVGNHESLSEKKGLYWNLIKQQQTEEEAQKNHLKHRLSGE